MASEVTIGDLGGLPLLTVRDTAMRGWQLTVKRVIDMLGGAGWVDPAFSGYDAVDNFDQA
jgi:hypothetical protein